MQCIRYCCSSARKLSFLVHGVTLCIHVNPGFPIVVICLMPHVLFLLDVCTKIVDKLLHACRLYAILVFLWNAYTRLSKSSPDTGNQREFRVEKFTVEKKNKHLVLKTMSVAKLLKRLKNRR